jgi:hypothetical protein
MKPAIFNMRTQPIPAPDPDRIVGGGVMVVDPLRQMPIFDRFRPFLPPTFRDCPCATSAVERGHVATVLNIVQLPERPKGSSPVAIIALDHRGPVAAIETEGLQTVFNLGASVGLKPVPTADIRSTRHELFRSAQQKHTGMHLVELETVLGPAQAAPVARILDRVDVELGSSRDRNPAQNLLESGWLLEVYGNGGSPILTVAHSADLLPVTSHRAPDSPRDSKRQRMEDRAAPEPQDRTRAQISHPPQPAAPNQPLNVGSELRSILARRRAESASSVDSATNPVVGQKRRRSVEGEVDGESGRMSGSKENPLELESSGSSSLGDIQEAAGAVPGAEDAENDSVQSVAGSASQDDDALYAPVSYEDVAPMVSGEELEPEGELYEDTGVREEYQRDRVSPLPEEGVERDDEEMSPLLRKANEHRAPSEVSDTIHSLEGEILLREKRARTSSVLQDSGVDTDEGGEEQIDEGEEVEEDEQREEDFYEDATGAVDEPFSLELPIQTGLGGGVTRTVVVDSSIPAPETLLVPSSLARESDCPVRLGFGSQAFMEAYADLHVLDNEEAALAVIRELERLSSASERCILEDEQPLPTIPAQLELPSKGPFDILPFIIPSLQRWTPPAEVDPSRSVEREEQDVGHSPNEADGVDGSHAQMQYVHEEDDPPELAVEEEVIEDV